MHSPSFKTPDVPLVLRAGIRHGVGALLGAILVFSLIHLFLVSAKGVYWTPTSQYLAAWVKIKRAISESTPSPKMLLVGGSNVFYGLRAGRLQELLEIPVVNMGTHGGLPASFLFYELRDQVNPGDVVLYAPEYIHFFEDPWALNSAVITFLVAQEQSFLNSLAAEDYARMLLTLPPQNFFARWLHDPNLLERQTQQVYKRSMEVISPHGDYQNNRRQDVGPREIQLMKSVNPLDLVKSTTGVKVPGPESQAFLHEVIKFRDQLIERQAILLFTWPNTIYDDSHRAAGPRAFFEDVTRYLESNGIPVVGDPYEAMAPKDEFFDTVYHPTAEFAEKRTMRLLLPLSERLTQLGRLPTN